MDITKHCILILDIGKTHSKISLVKLSSGQLVSTSHFINKKPKAENYQSLDIDAIWNWFIEQIAHLKLSFSITQITVTTHGAAAAVIDDIDLIFPIIDYEYDCYNDINNSYNKLRPNFQETGSANLPQGLNLGRQLFYLQKSFPKQWEKAKYILMLPQYFCWKLTGVAVSEITSLGCHSDLWDMQQHQFSSLVKNCHWSKLFPAVTKTGNILGEISQNIVTKTGLNKTTVVLNGVHDSNATLIPYLDENQKSFNVISSGTWAVISAIVTTSQSAEFNKDSVIFNTASDEIMYSINYQNTPVASMRFMGGREWQVIQEENITEFTVADINDVIALKCFAVPSFASGGPFAQHEGEIIGGNKLTGAQRSALATLYIALMSRYCLDELNNEGNIIVEGSFTKNTTYLQLLQQLSSESTVLISSDQTGTTLGASRLSTYSTHWQTVTLTEAATLDIPNLANYYKQWLKHLPFNKSSFL